MEQETWKTPKSLSTLVFLSAYEIVGAFHELKLYLPKEASKVTE
jgi:hypothetical protein